MILVLAGAERNIKNAAGGTSSGYKPFNEITKFMITYDDFEKVDVRVGTIIEVKDFPEAKIPAYKLVIDFGNEIGVKRSSSRITKHYKKEDLPGKQVLGVVNFPPRQVGPFMSEVLILGLYDENEDVVLITADKEVPNGKRMA
jgi:tRNA-binding protein